MRSPSNRGHAGSGRGWLALVLVPLLLDSLAAPARACTGDTPSIGDRTLWTGTTPPLNVQPVVAYHRAPESGGLAPGLGMDLLLRTGDGTQVAMVTDQKASGTFVLRPQAPLVPGQRYEVLDRRRVPCLGADCSALADEPQLIGSFTPTAVTDNEPPRFGGLDQLASGGEYWECHDCCTPYGGYSITIVSRPGPDDLSGDDIRFNVYYRRNSAAALAQVASFVRGELAGDPAKGLQRLIMFAFLACSGESQRDIAVQPGHYMVRAVDSAGNEDPNMTLRVLGDLCHSVPPTPTTSPMGQRSAGGCTLAPAGTPVPHGWWLLPAAAVVVLHTRTRRRRARFRPEV